MVTGIKNKDLKPGTRGKIIGSALGVNDTPVGFIGRFFTLLRPAIKFGDPVLVQFDDESATTILSFTWIVDMEIDS